MKKIIIPTDFSPAALNATHYAMDMALAINGSLHLLHIYQLPISVTDAPLVLISVDELKENAEKKLISHKSKSLDCLNAQRYNTRKNVNTFSSLEPAPRMCIRVLS